MIWMRLSIHVILIIVLSTFPNDLVAFAENMIHVDKLMIATVLDINEDSISRDVFTLIRSLRKTGKMINSATLLVCIPINDNPSSLLDNHMTLDELGALRVEIVFVHQTRPPFSKTLNKFEAFRHFDYDRFDYFLWLDADVVVFDDPTTELSLHKHPGSIECVPDFYSYIRRYPSLNLSSIVWNPYLPSFTLLGENEVAPHGTCNTGVLYFDRLSLKRFVDYLPSIETELLETNKLVRDRFLDSLYFVAIVNRIGMEVTILPYSMNYMALFEVEILEETDTRDITLAQFLSHTEMYCFNKNHADTLSCGCLYDNTHIPNESVIVKKMEKLLGNDICNAMSGASPVFTYSQKLHRSLYGHLDNNYVDRACLETPRFDLDKTAMPQEITVNDQSIQGLYASDSQDLTDVADPQGCSDIANCASMDHGSDMLLRIKAVTVALKWPPSDDFIVRTAAPTDPIRLPIHLCIRLQASIINDTVHVHVESALTLWIGSDETYASKRGQAFPIYFTNDFRIYHDKEHSNRDASDDPSHSDHCFMLDVTADYSRLVDDMQASSFLDFDMNVTANIPLNGIPFAGTSAPLAKPESEIADPAPQTVSYVDTREFETPEPIPPQAHCTVEKHIFMASATGRLVISSLQSSGSTTYSWNPLTGSKPLAFASQLHLGHYLNERGSIGGTAAVVCCDTLKGVQVVKNLIRQWQGDFLLIIVSSVPPELYSTTTSGSSNGSDFTEVYQNEVEDSTLFDITRYRASRHKKRKKRLFSTAQHGFQHGSESHHDEVRGRPAEKHFDEEEEEGGVESSMAPEPPPGSRRHILAEELNGLCNRQGADILAADAEALASVPLSSTIASRASTRGYRPGSGAAAKGNNKKHVPGQLLRCMIVPGDEELSLVLARTMRPRYLTFVYNDVFVDYNSYLDNMRQWFAALSPGGLLMGSRYTIGSDSFSARVRERQHVETTRPSSVHRKNGSDPWQQTLSSNHFTSSGTSFHHNDKRGHQEKSEIEIDPQQNSGKESSTIHYDDKVNTQYRGGHASEYPFLAISDAVDTFSHSSSQVPLMTFNEAHPRYCAAAPAAPTATTMSTAATSASVDTFEANCSPAWYFFKLRK